MDSLLKPSISICVPAYNDLTSLQLTVESLLQNSEVQRLLGESKLEILISNNCSTDETDRYLSFLENLDFKYYSQDKNLGFRGNIEFLAKEAKGEWVLYLTCGDQIVEDFDFEHLFLNLSFSRNSTCFYSFEMKDQRTQTRFGSLVISDFEAKQTHTIFSTAPMPIWRRIDLQQTIATLKPISGNWWPQVEWALELCKSQASASYVSPGPITGFRPSNGGWWEKPEAYKSVLHLDMVLNVYAMDHPLKSIIQEAILENRKALPNWIYAEKVVYSHGIRVRNKVELLKFFAKSKSFSAFIAFIVAIVPTGLLKIVARVKNSVSS